MTIIEYKFKEGTSSSQRVKFKEFIDLWITQGRLERISDRVLEVEEVYVNELLDVVDEHGVAIKKTIRPTRDALLDNICEKIIELEEEVSSLRQKLAKLESDRC